MCWIQPARGDIDLVSVNSIPPSLSPPSDATLQEVGHYFSFVIVLIEESFIFLFSSCIFKDFLIDISFGSVGDANAELRK